MVTSATLDLAVEDFTGQVRHRARGIPRESTIAELVSSVSRQLQLPDQDSQGRPVMYGARSAQGDVLNLTDKVGDVLNENELVTLTKSVTAG